MFRLHEKAVEGLEFAGLHRQRVNPNLHRASAQAKSEKEIPEGGAMVPVVLLPPSVIGVLLMPQHCRWVGTSLGVGEITCWCRN